jgi:hypothetical protein
MYKIKPAQMTFSKKMQLKETVAGALTYKRELGSIVAPLLEFFLLAGRLENRALFALAFFRNGVDAHEP